MLPMVVHISHKYQKSRVNIVLRAQVFNFVTLNMENNDKNCDHVFKFLFLAMEQKEIMLQM